MLAGVFHVIVAFQHSPVILRYGTLYSSTGYACVRRQQLAVLRVVVHVFQNVLGHSQLIGKLEQRLVVSAALLHVLGQYCLDVGQEVAALVIGNLLIHITQFL